MPVPKRKVSRARRDKRSATWAIKPQAVSICGQGSCGEPKLPHQVCPKCGFYGKKKVLRTKMDRELTRDEVRKTEAQQSKAGAGSTDDTEKE